MSIEDNINYGFVKLFRSIKKHWLWKDPERLQWWIDLLLEVNHSDEKVLIKNELIECRKGQTVRSMETWAKEWKTSRGTVKRFLELLQSDSMIKIENLNKTSRITLCNYESYADWRTADGQQTNSRRTAHGQHTDTNNNDNNYKNGNKNTVSAIAEAKQKEAYGFLVKDILTICRFIRENKPKFIEPYADLWNMFCDSRLGGKRKVEDLLDYRKQKIRTRVKEEKFDMEKILGKAKDCTWLLDWNGFDFDWITENQKNYTKILGGRYDNNQSKEEIKKHHDESEYIKKRQEAEKRNRERINGSSATA